VTTARPRARTSGTATARRRRCGHRLVGTHRYRGISRKFFTWSSSPTTGSRTRALLEAAGGASGASLAWDVRQLPCFTQWKNPQSPAAGFVTGLEPGTTIRISAASRSCAKRVVPLASGATWRVDLDLEYHPDRAAVERAAKEVARIAAGKTPILHSATLPKYAPL